MISVPLRNNLAHPPPFPNSKPKKYKIILICTPQLKESSQIVLETVLNVALHLVCVILHVQLHVFVAVFVDVVVFVVMTGYVFVAVNLNGLCMCLCMGCFCGGFCACVWVWFFVCVGIVFMGLVLCRNDLAGDLSGGGFEKVVFWEDGFVDKDFGGCDFGGMFFWRRWLCR